jgi:hypothetical protein
MRKLMLGTIVLLGGCLTAAGPMAAAEGPALSGKSTPQSKPRPTAASPGRRAPLTPYVAGEGDPRILQGGRQQFAARLRYDPGNKCHAACAAQISVCARRVQQCAGYPCEKARRVESICNAEFRVCMRKCKGEWRFVPRS